jgi:uncharacterized protein (TIGR02001 family)
MRSFNIKKSIIAKLLLFIIIAAPLYAQELSVGTDFVSRYVWRGTDFGNSPSIQPTVAFSTGGLSIGFWGAYATNDPYQETDFYGGYSFDLQKSGSLYIGFTDYMFPGTGFDISNFNNYDDPDGAGSHFIEINASYSGPESVPLSLSFNIFVHNVMDNPIYFELGYSIPVKDVGLSLFLGGSAGDGAAYYGSTKNFDIVNTGIKASKEIKITDSFSLPVFGSVSLNPATNSLFYVVGFSL